MKSYRKNPYFWALIVLSSLFISETIVDVYYKRARDKELDQIHSQLSETSLALAAHILDNQQEFDLTSSRIEILEDVISKDKKRSIHINKTVVAIKKHLSPNALCPESLHSGELLRIASAVVDLSDRYAVPAALVLGVIQQESSFCRRATSPVGAQGYMQLMPETATQVSNEIGVALNVWSSRDNIHLGVAYLSQLLTIFNGDIDLAVKAYNAGPNHVRKVQAGIYKEYFAETADYAVKVQAHMKEFELSGITW